MLSVGGKMFSMGTEQIKSLYMDCKEYKNSYTGKITYAERGIS